MFTIKVILLSISVMLAGCAWDSDFRDRKQPEDYLDQSEPVVID